MSQACGAPRDGDSGPSLPCAQAPHGIPFPRPDRPDRVGRGESESRRHDQRGTHVLNFRPTARQVQSCIPS